MASTSRSAKGAAVEGRNLLADLRYNGSSMVGNCHAPRAQTRSIMQIRFFSIVAAASLTLGLFSFSPALAADEDPTVAQIYQAFRAGHLAEAQGMLDRVLRDHPNSAKAHFVQAEIDAAEGHKDLARSELARAEQLKPGLPDVKPRAVKALKQKLGLPAD
jgi:tetratricopeptide (TPR) repeat protein